MSIRAEVFAKATRSQLPKLVLDLVGQWKTPEEVEQDCKAIVEARMNRSKSTTVAKKVNTASADLTPVRKAIAGLDVSSLPKQMKTIDIKTDTPIHIAYDLLRVKREDREEQRSVQREDTVKRHDEREQSKAFDVEPWLELCKVWIDSNDPIESGIAVMIATGRRPAEVFGLTEFKALDESRCWVRGLAKKKGLYDRETYIIPTLLDSESIAAAIERIRASLPASEWQQNGSDSFNSSPVYDDVLRVYKAEFKPMFEEHGFTGQALRNFRYLYEGIVGELAEQQFSARFRATEYVARALSHEGEGSANNYARFKIESIPSEIKLPKYEDIGPRGTEPADSPFSDRYTMSLSKLFDRINHYLQDAATDKAESIQAKVSELMQQGHSVEDAIAVTLVGSKAAKSAESKPSKREMARQDVDRVIDAMMQHNKESRENGFDDEICIVYTTVERVLKAWRQKKGLAQSLWDRAEEKRGSEIREHHIKVVGIAPGKPSEERQAITDRGYALRGDKMSSIVENIVNILNANV